MAAAATTNRTEILLSLPNPFTPMAFLPPDLAWQWTVSIYWIVGGLAVLIWDILSNLHSDYILLIKHPFKVSMVMYCISRITALAYTTTLTVFFTAPIGDCSWLGPLHVLYAFTTTTTYLLFFFRVCALYYNNKFVKAFFFLSWLGVLGAGITPILGVRGTRIGVTDYCVGQKLPSYVGLAVLIPLINDALVYCATTYALLRKYDSEDGVRTGANVVAFKNHLPAFFRAVLRDGQVYYLTILSLAIASTAMIFVPSVPAVYAFSLGLPITVVVANCMTCLVYRRVRFGDFRETAANLTVTLHFAGPASDASSLVVRGTDGPHPRTTTTRTTTANDDDLANQVDQTSSAAPRSLQMLTRRENENGDEDEKSWRPGDLPVGSGSKPMGMDVVKHSTVYYV